MNLTIELDQLRTKYKLSDDQVSALKENRKWADKLNNGFQPLMIKTNEPALVCSDWHIPFQDRGLVKQMLGVAKKYKIKQLIIPGDFWDCDGYKNTEKFVNLTYMETFQDEKVEVRNQLEQLTNYFGDKIYFCRGNHEKRWLKFNKGMVGIDELFAILRSPVNYHVTLDDYIVLYQNGVKWYICHPDNYSPVSLSIASKISDKFQCNVFMAHGHIMSQGFDRTGQYEIVDGGGMFDSDQIEYLRRTTTFPSVRSGFYVLKDGISHRYLGKGVSRP